MLRSLTHYWRVNLAVALAAAVAAAVLTGALLVGDSVKGSLRDLALDRLGRIDQVVLGNAFFREEVAEALARVETDTDNGLANGAPMILLRGSAIHADTGARAAGTAVLGVDERFASMYPTPLPDLSRRQGQIFPSVVLNTSLARELDAHVGVATSGIVAVDVTELRPWTWADLDGPLMLSFVTERSGAMRDGARIHADAAGLRVTSGCE